MKNILAVFADLAEFQANDKKPFLFCRAYMKIENRRLAVKPQVAGSGSEAAVGQPTPVL
jgi:hypothetical protein